MEPTEQERIEQNDAAVKHEVEKLFRPAKKQTLAAIRRGRDFSEEPARGVTQDPQKYLPKGGSYVDRTQKVLSFSWFNAANRQKKADLLVPYKITEEEVEALVLKTVKDGTIAGKVRLFPYAPKA